ncbi:hypothetical protein ACFL5Z_01710 [Planctomycetota bacterium]
MARNRGKKALYEVMSKARQKPGYGRSLEQMPPKSAGESGPDIEEKSAVETSKGMVQWSRKPRLFQYNGGRIEFSMPYQVAIALALALILVILASYRLGQFSYQPQEQKSAQPSGLMRQVEQENRTQRAAIELPPSSPTPVENIPPQTERVETDIDPEASTGNNVIVLVEYHSPADLGPVQAHFEEHGITTEIRMRNGRYFLQTVDRYDNPDKPGTDGNKAKEKIIEIGKTYKAPSGYDPFSKHYFSDAYGKKVD